MPTCYTAIAGDTVLDKQRLFPSPIPGSAVWTTGSNSVHLTTSGEFLYNKRYPRSEEEASLVVLTGAHLQVECYGTLDLVVHCDQDVHVTLHDVAVVPGFAFGNAISIPRLVDMGGQVVMGPTGVSALNGQLRFVHGDTGNYAQATRVPHDGLPAQ